MSKPLVAMSLKEMAALAKEVHGEQYKYLRKEICQNRKTYITFKCTVCKTVTRQCAHGHLFKKSGCPKCAVMKTAQTRKSNVTKTFERAAVIHNDKYTYIRIISPLTKHIKRRIVMVCNNCGKELTQELHRHLAGIAPTHVCSF